MKGYLEKKIGARLSVTRVGLPKEIYFEAVLKAVDDQVAIFLDERGNEIALALDKILMIGPAEESGDRDRSPVGFTRP